MTEDYQIDIDYIESQFNTEFEGLDIHVTEREIGNGPQFAIEAYESDSGSMVHESYWYTKDEFEAFCTGMKQVGVLFQKAAKARDE